MTKIPERKLKSDEKGYSDALKFPLCENACNEPGENKKLLDIHYARAPHDENACNELCENENLTKIDRLYSDYYHYKPRHSHKKDILVNETLQTLDLGENAHDREMNKESLNLQGTRISGP